MRRLEPVVWTKGTFLNPQHLQSQDRFLDLLLAECAASNASLVFVSHDRRLASHFTREVALHEINQAAEAAQEAVA